MQTVDEKIQSNAGLKDFDISQYQGISGKNYFEIDRLLKNVLAAALKPDQKEDLFKHLSCVGELCGNRLAELIEEAHREENLPYLRKYDRTGNRIDEIVYCSAQREARKICFDQGFLNLDCHASWKHPFTEAHRRALYYLLSQNGEGGIACALGATEGLVNVLRKIGTDEQKEKWLPLLTAPASGSHFMGTQWMTERVGGSNISANRTTAKKSHGNKWKLTGEKWFCSNPGDLWVTTARVEGTSHIGLFIVPRFKDDGSLNDYHILRKKEIIGTRGKATVETIYDGVEAELLGRSSQGLAMIMKHVINISRIGVAATSLGFIRRAFNEAYEYSLNRTAYGKKLIEYMPVRRSLVQIKGHLTVSLLLLFTNARFTETNHPLAHFFIPFLKLQIAKFADDCIRESMFLHGGNGVIRDFTVLPRLMNDNIVNQTWEGTRNLMEIHSVKAFTKPKINHAFWEFASPLSSSQSRPDKESVRSLRSIEENYRSAGHEEKEVLRRILLDAIWRVSAKIVLGKESTQNQSASDPFPAHYFSFIGESYDELLTTGNVGYAHLNSDRFDVLMS